MADKFQIREVLNQQDVDEIYDIYDNLFSVRLHHGGRFVEFPKFAYIEAKESYVDLLNTDKFSMHDMHLVMIELGYVFDEENPVFYHFLPPGQDLMFGLEMLGNDSDVLGFLRVLKGHRMIDVYTEHGKSVLDKYYFPPNITIEQLKENQGFSNLTNNRLLLGWGDGVEVGQSTSSVQESRGSSNLKLLLFDELDEYDPIVHGMDTQASTEPGPNDNNVDAASQPNSNTKDSAIDAAVDTPNITFAKWFDWGNTVGASQPHSAIEAGNTLANWLQFIRTNKKVNTDVVDKAVSEAIDDAEDVLYSEGLSEYERDSLEEDDNESDSSEDDDSQDSDFKPDETTVIDDIEVDMRDFKLHVDDGVDVHKQNLEVDDAEDVLNNDFFDSGSDSDDFSNSIRKRKLRQLRMSNEANPNFYLGQNFENKAEAKKLIKLHAVKSRRNLKILKDEKLRMRVICEGSMPGFEINDDGAHIPTKVEKNVGSSSKDRGLKGKLLGGRGNKTNPEKNPCPWVLFLSRGNELEHWMVKTFNSQHKCLPTRSVTQCTSAFLADQLMDQIEENPQIPIKAVQEQFQRKFEVGISRMKAFREKTRALKQLQGDYMSQYGLLRDYVDELKARNPNTTVKLDMEIPANPNETTRQFKRIYVCLGPLKQGFKAIKRDMLGLDGAFMKGPFPGQVLTAVGIDSNNGIYPLSYVIVEAENLSAWIWFLECLQDDLDLNTDSKFTFVSDRQKGILPAIARVFPRAEHIYCLRHINENMKLTFKGKVYKDYLWRLATSTTPVYFDKAMEDLKKFNNEAAVWISKIPPQHWSRAHFSGWAHSDVLLNNMCECFNAKIVDGRDKPIITALEFIREYLMRRIVNVLKVIDKSDGLLTPTASRWFESIKKEATKYNVSWNGGEQYEVSGPKGDQFVVDLSVKFCVCRRWEVTGIPCKHAVAAIWDLAANGANCGQPEDWVHPTYRLETWKETYSHKIFPINGRSMWVIAKCPTTLTAPKHHKPIGRPKKVRKKAVTEMEDITKGTKLSRKNTSGKCSKCHKKGHNSRTCKGQEEPA